MPEFPDQKRKEARGRLSIPAPHSSDNPQKGLKGMTEAKDVKLCAASLKGIEAGLSVIALETDDSATAKTIHEAMHTIHGIAEDLRTRITELEIAKPGSGGF